jgi:hypothetical protein
MHLAWFHIWKGENREHKVPSEIIGRSIIQLHCSKRTGWVPCSRTCPPRLKSPTWHGCLHFPTGFNGAILSVVGDVPVNSEAPVVTSSVSRFAGPTKFFGGAHMGRVCVCAFIRVSVHSCMWASASNRVSQKKTLLFQKKKKQNISRCSRKRKDIVHKSITKT